MDNFELAWPFRTLNYLGRNFPIDLSEDSLLDKACRHTGLTDWGDNSFRTGLRVLLEADEHEAELSSIGRMMVRYDYLRILTNRLRIEAAFRRDPAILAHPVRQPVFIIGFPRTGTTLLHNLLAQDPQTRVPMMWELMWAPPLDKRSDPRIRWAKQGIQVTYALMPKMRFMHPLHATGPEECLFLLANDFACLEFEVQRYIPSYVSWFFKQDLVPVYESFRRQVQLLHSQMPGERWVLKSPFHLPALDALLKVFPDACLIHPHRDPAEVVPSMCSITNVVRKTHSRRVDSQRLGRDWLDTWGTAMSRAMHVRATADPKRFFDIDYRELVCEPLMAVQRLYSYLGWSFTPGVSARMADWLSRNTQHKHGTHQYTLEQFGVTRGMVDDRFADYIKTYGCGRLAWKKKIGVNMPVTPDSTS